MRENMGLYRGKRKDNEKCVEGYLYPAIGIDRGKWLITAVDNSLTTSTTYEVDPESVGQYTGLTDKNGKRIFEGDIVRLIDEHNEIEWTAVVVFGNPNSEYNWGWQLKAIGEFDGNKDILLWVDMEESGAYCEIISNIHDDPELLR